MVTSSRGLYFGVTSDILSSHTVAFFFLIGNIILVWILVWFSSCLKKTNLIRQFINREKWQMIFGQIINIMIPLTLPWTFVMMDTGLRNFKTKINAICYILLFFVGLFFPIYYFFHLLQEREN
jgi:hypothetical protein